MIPRRNIILFHLGALGDFVLTWPLALALSRIHPQSRIIYITHAQKGALAERVLGVEWRDIEMGWHHLYGDAGQLPLPAMRLLAGAHSIYSFVASAGDFWVGNVRRLAADVDVCCLDPRPTGPTRHATEHMLEQLSSRPAVREAVWQVLRHINGTGLKAGRGESTDRRVVAIHPGSGAREKCWPAENFVELARRFREGGWSVRILIGDVERERWGASQIAGLASVGEVIQPPTYLDLWRSLVGVRVFVGNDSGPSHLAGIMGVGAVCLFGPTDPAIWHPLGPRVEVLHRVPLDSLTVEEVDARCQRHLR